MKKRNIFLISVIVLIIIFLVFLYIFRLKFSKETNLLCTFKGYNTTLKTNIDTSVLSTFKGNKLDKINLNYYKLYFRGNNWGSNFTFLQLFF